jgi:AhpD family alkylhydroperoxidase
MNRIHQLNPEEAIGKTAQLYAAIEAKLGFVPNLMRMLGNSPAAMEGYLGLSGAIARGALSARVREQIALAVTEVNGCGYCLSALFGGKAGLSSQEIAAARQAESTNDQTEGILQLARSITIQHGHDEDPAQSKNLRFGVGTWASPAGTETEHPRARSFAYRRNPKFCCRNRKDVRQYLASAHHGRSYGL